MAYPSQQHPRPTSQRRDDDQLRDSAHRSYSSPAPFYGATYTPVPSQKYPTSYGPTLQSSTNEGQISYVPEAWLQYPYNARHLHHAYQYPRPQYYWNAQDQGSYCRPTAPPPHHHHQHAYEHNSMAYGKPRPSGTTHAAVEDQEHPRDAITVGVRGGEMVEHPSMDTRSESGDRERAIGGSSLLAREVGVILGPSTTPMRTKKSATKTKKVASRTKKAATRTEKAATRTKKAKSCPMSRAKGVVGKVPAKPREPSMFSKLIDTEGLPLIQRFIGEAPNQRMYLPEIHAKFKTMFPALNNASQKETSLWKDRIRKTLETQHKYVKVECPPKKGYPGHYWTLDPELRGAKKRLRKIHATQHSQAPNFASTALPDPPRGVVEPEAPPAWMLMAPTYSMGIETMPGPSLFSTVSNPRLRMQPHVPGILELARVEGIMVVRSPAPIVGSRPPINQSNPPQGFVESESPLATTSTHPAHSASIDTTPRPSLFATVFDPDLKMLPWVPGMPELAVEGISGARSWANMVSSRLYPIDHSRHSRPRTMIVRAPSETLDGPTLSGSSNLATPTWMVGPSRIVTTGGGMPLQGVPPPHITKFYATPNTFCLKEHEGTGEYDCHLGSAAADLKGKGKARAL